MGGARVSSAPAGRFAAALGGCLILAACVSDDPQTPRPLFRTPVGDLAGGVAPGPSAVWYAPAEPVRFVKIGVAAWMPDRPRGWLGRLLRRRTLIAAGPAAIAAAGLGLPAPSRVQVTNVATGQTVTLRVEDQARLEPGVVLRLPASVAAGLGADPHRQLLVRVRYLAPLIAYEARPALRTGLRGPLRAPAAPPVLLAAAGPPPVPTVPPSSSPAAPSAPEPAREIATALRGAIAAPAALAARVVRVQAGAFANLANAQRAAGRLAPAGPASIQPLRQGGVTLYRVIVAGPAGPDAAERLRASVAQIGFPDARPL